MCGICGIINSNLPEIENFKIVKRMCDSMVHRGPDDWGYKSFGPHCLGMRRLSIIDISEKGHQPMPNEDETIWVVCNGEIYNFQDKKAWLISKGHQFRSNTDIEIMVHLFEEFGIDCLKHLRGMYCFALYDSRNNQFYLARDRLGIKPVYYIQYNGMFLFSSELRSLVSSRIFYPEIDFRSLDLYLSFGYVPQPNTLLKGVNALMPAHVLSIRETEKSIWQYWTFPDCGSSNISVKDIVPMTRQLLEDTVSSHQISDVPLGAFLSGGIDSTAIVGLMSSLTNEPIKTFSVGFSDVSSQFNELDTARKTAQQFGTEHREVIISERDVAYQIDDIIRHMDHPSFDGINSYFVSKAAKSGGVTVAVSGLGGDEIFGGYGSFNVIPASIRAISLWKAVPVSLRDLIVKIIGSFKIPWIGATAKRKINNLPDIHSPIGLYCLARLLLWPKEKKSMYSKDMLRALNSTPGHEVVEELLMQYVNCNSNPWYMVSLLEMNSYMTWRLLRDTDVMSMAHSLEVRVPFVDHKLIEFICSLPEGWEKKWGYPKKLLVESLSDIIPDHVVNRAKHGFEFPMSQWMKNELRDIVEDALSKETIKSRGLFEVDKIRELCNGFYNDLIPYPVIWQFVVLELWMRSMLDRS